VALDDLLPKHAPKLWASMPPATWNAARVNGKIYGAINQQIFVKPWGVYVRKDLADKYKLDLNAISKFEDLEPFFKAVKEGEQGVTPLFSDDAGAGSVFRPEYFGIDPVLEAAGVGVKADDKTLKPTNFYDTAEFKQGTDLARKWYQAGYYTKDPLPPSDAIAAFKAGKYAAILHISKPGGEVEYKTRYGYDFVHKGFTKPLLTTGSTTATLNGVSRTSANPERAVMFLELLNTDKQIYNLITKGIEGKHYAFTDKDKGVIGFPAGVDAKTTGYNPSTDWMFGNQFNAFYGDPAQVGSWDATYKLNQEATPSVALGFAVNSEKVKTEVAQVSALVKQYSLPLMRGQADPAVLLPEFQNKPKQAGMDKLLEEIQQQLGQWQKAKS
jgi:putative aldouronate transport system substrate-binding protein